MKRQFLFIPFVTVLFAVFGTGTALENCNKFYTKYNESGENYMSIKLKKLDVLNNLPLQIFFSHPILDIVSNKLNAAKVNSQHWNLTLKPEMNSTFNGSNDFIHILYDDEDLTITNMSSLFVLCSDEDFGDFDYSSTDTTFGDREYDNTSTVDDEEFDDGIIEPNFIPFCGSQLCPIDLNPDQVLERKGKWDSGRNYLIKIPSYETFVGYIVDLFFTKPVTGFSGLSSDVKATQFTPTHWALSKEFTESACVKLNKIFFTISFEEESDVEAMLFNGKPLIGQGKSFAVFKNKNINNAIDARCEKYFKRDHSWFGTEKGKIIIFAAPINSDEDQLGVVVEFIFEKNIKEITVWDLTAQMLTGNHWKLYNSGFTVIPNGVVTFEFKVGYYDHFHVKVNGVKLNGKVLCGLGSNVYISNDMKTVEKQNRDIIYFYATLQVTVTFVSLSMVISIAVISSLLVKKFLFHQAHKKHLFDFPSRELPMQLIKDDSSVDNPVCSEESNISQM